MRFQSRPGACAPATICNALEVIGVHRAERKVRIEAGTTPEGTGQHGILQALERADVNFSEIEQVDFTPAYSQLFAHLQLGGSAILLTEAGEHWECAIGVCGTRVIIFNPDRDRANKRVNGVHILTRRQLANYWNHYAEPGRRAAHHAVLVGPK